MPNVPDAGPALDHLLSKVDPLSDSTLPVHQSVSNGGMTTLVSHIISYLHGHHRIIFTSSTLFPFFLSHVLRDVQAALQAKMNHTAQDR